MRWTFYIIILLWDLPSASAAVLPRHLSNFRTIGQFQTQKSSLIARFMVPTWGPPGADKTQVGPMLAAWSLLSGLALRSYDKAYWILKQHPCCSGSAGATVVAHGVALPLYRDCFLDLRLFNSPDLRRLVLCYCCQAWTLETVLGGNTALPRWWTARSIDADAKR